MSDRRKEEIFAVGLGWAVLIAALGMAPANVLCQGRIAG